MPQLTQFPWMEYLPMRFKDSRITITRSQKELNPRSGKSILLTRIYFIFVSPFHFVVRMEWRMPSSEQGEGQFIDNSIFCRVLTTRDSISVVWLGKIEFHANHVQCAFNRFFHPARHTCFADNKQEVWLRFELDTRAFKSAEHI